MIIDRAFYREATAMILAVAVVLLIVVTLMTLTLLLGRAARGDQSEAVLYVLLGYQMMAKIDILLPLAFYLGILLTLSRWYRDSEMTVLAACGVGVMHFLKPVTWLALACGFAVLISAFYLTPLAARQIEKVKVESTQHTEPGLISPGVFTEAHGARRIVYAEKVTKNGDLEGIFVSSMEQGRQGVLIAKSGHTFTDGKTGDKFLALQDGVLYDGEPGTADYRILEFGVYSLRIEPKKTTEAPVPTEGLPTLDLLSQYSDRNVGAELHWRIGKTIALFVLMLYAVAISYTDVRRGQLSNLFAAIVVYFVYSNLLGVGKTMLQNGPVPLALGLWWVHVVMALAATYLLWRRANNRPLISLPAVWRRE